MNIEMTVESVVNRYSRSWENASQALANYSNYLNNKPEAERYKLTFIDLLYISNFKGGNATMNQPEKEINQKLNSYSVMLREISIQFRETELAQLSRAQLQQLTEAVVSIDNLTRQPDTAIAGFKSSFLSALLHAHFPRLIPILDRRVLVNLKIVKQTNDQVPEIYKNYKRLIEKVYEKCKELNKSVREIDKEYFIIDWNKKTN